MIPYGKQDINQTDIDAVVSVLKSGFLTQGSKVPAFEQAVADRVGAKFAVAVNSATSALHIACLALDVKPGDLVWTTPITFVASANCAIYCGADIDFVDIEPTTGNLCPKAFKNKLEQAKQAGRLPKVVIPVHLAGHSCDMQAIGMLAQQYKVRVIEDASHAIGGQFQGCEIGSCEYSDITVFSFHPVKVITTAEGGIATTQEPLIAERMKLLRSHGITKDPASMIKSDEGDWYYEQHLLGFNYRMTDIQAALGISQLARLDEFVQKRNALAELYCKELEGLPLNIVEPLASSISARHLFVIRLMHPQNRKMVFDGMRKLNIQVHVHYFPVHLQPYYQQLGFYQGQFLQAERFYQSILTLPLYPDLTREQVVYICASLKTFLS